MQTALHCLLDVTPHAALLVDASARVVIASSRAASLLGHAPAELARRPLDELVAEPSRARLREARLALLGAADAAGAPRTEATLLLRRDGRELSTQLELHRVEHAGEPALLIVLHIPQALPQLEPFSLALEAAPTGMILSDAAGRIVLANARAERMFGYERGELAGEPVERLVPAAVRDRHRRLRSAFSRQAHTRAMGAGQDLHGVSKDGRLVPVEIGLNALSLNGTHYVLASIADITERKRATDHFRLALEAAPTGMLVVNEHGRILIANAQIEKIFGYAHGELVGQRLETLVPARERDLHIEQRARFLEAPTPRAMGAGRDLYGLHRDGREVPVEIALTPLDTGEGRLVVASVVDISARKLAERAQHESEARHRALFEDSPVPLLEQDLSATRAHLAQLEASGVASFDAFFEAHPGALREAIGSVETLMMNQCALELFETHDASRLADPALIYTNETARWFQAALRELWAGRRSFGGDTTIRTLTGAPRTVGMRIHLLPGHTETWSRAVLSLFDLTAHQQAEERLRSSLREKEVLLREVHHRVKNNLQIVSSLLNLKADSIDNSTAQQVFADCQARIRSLAFVHEHLYVAADLSHVPFGQYVRTLAEHLEHSFRAPGQQISVRVAIGELNLSLEDAIPCGLIVNELVTNSLKHAFVSDGAGHIEIRMRRLAGHRLELSVSDDGKGLPSGFSPGDTGNSGLDLVYTFAEQLGAEVEVSCQQGTCFTFRFAAAGPSCSLPDARG